MKLSRVFPVLCIALGWGCAVHAQDAQAIIDSAAKVYAGAEAYTASVDVRTLQMTFAPAPEGQPPRYSSRGSQYRSLQLRVKRPYNYYLGVYYHRDAGAQGAPGGMGAPGAMSVSGNWSILARTDTALPKQGVHTNGQFTVRDLPAEQFNAMANSRLGTRASADVVLRHFQALPAEATGTIPLDLLEPELIGREGGGKPLYRIVAKTSDGYPIMLWIEQGSYLIVRTVVQRPMGMGPMNGMPPGMAAGMGASRPGMVTVIETFYRDQQVNPVLSDRDFVINKPDLGAPQIGVQGGFCTVDELVKLADIGPLVASAKDKTGGSETGSGEVPDETGAPSATPPAPSVTAPSSGQALSQAQMEGIVLIEGEGSTASGFMTKIRDVDFIVTNLHVLGGGKKLSFKTLRGEEIPTLGVFGAVGSDIAIIRIGKGQGELTLTKDAFSTNKIGDKVVVVGNRLGGGVATQTAGSILGVGPTRIEVNANFEPGNSGSPIVNLGTGEVVGVATYSETRQVQVDEGTAATRNGSSSGGKVEQRWFGYRLDSVAKWESIDLVRWASQVDRIDKFHETSLALHAVVRLDFKKARQHPRLTTILDQFQDRYQTAGSNSVTAASEVKDLFRVIRTISDDGVKDLESGPYYDYFRTCLYWESSIPAQLEYRKAIIEVLKKYEANSSQFLSRMRNGG